MNQFEKMSPEAIAKRYGLFRFFRHFGATVFILFIALDLFTIGYALALGADLSFAFDYCLKTAKFGVLILICELWFCLRDVAVRGSLSKIGRVYGDYEKSSRVYEILVKKTKSKKLRSYFRYVYAQSLAALKKYDKAKNVLEAEDDRHISKTGMYSRCLLIEDCLYRMEDYAAFENVHSDTVKAGKEMKETRYTKWIFECNEKLFAARKNAIDKNFEEAKKFYDEALEALRKSEYTSMKSAIAEVSYEASKLSFDLGDTEDAYHKARTAVELGGSSWFAEEAKQLVSSISK